MPDFPICNWTIAIANSSENSIAILQARGSKQQVKKKLMDLVMEDHNRYFEATADDLDAVRSATVGEITENDGVLDTYIAFPDHSIQYTAVKYEQPTML